MSRLALLLPFLASPALADPSVRVAFSPNAGATAAVVQAIGEARHSIHLAAYGFTSRPIARALLDAHQRGVEVEAVLDKSNATARSTAVTFLVRGGIPVRIDDRYALMHNKFLVVDGRTVETGSFNYTAAAEAHNAENVLILRDYPDIARQYEARWQLLWDESEQYPGQHEVP